MAITAISAITEIMAITDNTGIRVNATTTANREMYVITAIKIFSRCKAP